MTAVTLDHIADFYCRYRGEPLTFSTRVRVQADLAPTGYELHLTLPPEIEPDRLYSLADSDLAPRVLTLNDEQQVIWEIAGPLKAGTQHEYRMTLTIQARDADWTLPSTAYIIAHGADGETYRTSVAVNVAVFAKGRYLRHLPTLYEDDEFMGRFLMLFESFWGPIEKQVDYLWSCFDPALAPAATLPWLAEWFDMQFDERLPEEARRKLIQSAVRIYRRRGCQSLEDYLEAATGVRPIITEHYARNFVLGPETRMGINFALGTGNAPYTMDIKMALPPLPSTGAPETDQRQAEDRRQLIERIIMAEKPAQVAYRLHLTPEKGKK